MGRIEEIQLLVHSAMERAMRARGLRTARALTRELNDRGFVVGERTVTSWRSREAAIPAWALVAFREISGITLDELMMLDDAASVVAALDRHERLIGDMQATLFAVAEKVGVPWHRGQPPVADRERATG